MKTILFLASTILLLSTLSKGKEKLEAAKPPLQLVYSPKYKISFMGLENLHPFDVGKYNKIYEALKNDGLAFDKNSHAPDPVTEEQLLLVHTKAYLKELEDPKKVSRYLEAPVLRHLPKGVLKRNVADRFKRASGGTIKAARLALEHGYAVNIGGGFHHAKPTKGEGFCIIADVPIAIRQLQKDKKIKKALIIDTDVHQGNGTVVCLANDPSTYTFSMHQGNIYPIPKEVGDKDIELKSGMKDEAYLAILERELPKLFAASKPDIVFYVAGCDTLSGDPLASLEMSHEGIAKRDLMVAASCFKHKVPFVMTLSGGYSKDAWKAQHLSIKGIAEWTIKNPF